MNNQTKEEEKEDKKKREWKKENTVRDVIYTTNHINKKII